MEEVHAVMLLCQVRAVSLSEEGLAVESAKICSSGRKFVQQLGLLCIAMHICMLLCCTALSS